jgi:hypothetical protein
MADVHAAAAASAASGRGLAAGGGGGGGGAGGGVAGGVGGEDSNVLLVTVEQVRLQARGMEGLRYGWNGEEGDALVHMDT